MSAPPTKCVVLAAGMSTRLRPQTDDVPKCLLNVGGRTILERMVDSLLLAGISDIAFVIGFRADKIRIYLQEKFPSQRFHFVLNPDFSSTNNAYSLLLARNYFEESKTPRSSKAQLMMLDADIIFHPSLLTMMEKADGGNRLAVRSQGKHDDEEVRVGVDACGDVVSIGKGEVSGTPVGESIGIELFDNATAKLLFEILAQRAKSGVGRSEYYEIAFQEIVAGGAKIKAFDVGNLPVIEVDSHADLEYARRVIVPEIEAMSHV